MRMGSIILKGVVYMTLFLAAHSLQATASSTDGASAFLKEYGGRALQQFADPNMSENEVKRRFAIMYEEGFANNSIAQFVLGRYWRKADATQRSTFENLYEQYLIQTYADDFRRFTGKFVIASSRNESLGVYVIATDVVFDPQSKPTQVEWRVGYADDHYRVYDIVVEGVSLAVTQRSEFSSVLRNTDGSFEQFFDILRKKIADEKK